MAFVQLQPGAKTSEEEIKDYANRRMARYKKIRILKIMEELPTNMEGRIQRGKLREKAEAL